MLLFLLKYPTTNLQALLTHMVCRIVGRAVCLKAHVEHTSKSDVKEPTQLSLLGKSPLLDRHCFALWQRQYVTSSHRPLEILISADAWTNVVLTINQANICHALAFVHFWLADSEVHFSASSIDKNSSDSCLPDRTAERARMRSKCLAIVKATKNWHRTHFTGLWWRWQPSSSFSLDEAVLSARARFCDWGLSLHCILSSS